MSTMRFVLVFCVIGALAMAENVTVDVVMPPTITSTISTVNVSSPTALINTTSTAKPKPSPPHKNATEFAASTNATVTSTTSTPTASSSTFSSTGTTPPTHSSTTAKQQTNSTTSPVSVSSSASSSTLIRTSSSNTTSSLSTDTTSPVFSSATTTRQETNLTTSPVSVSSSATTLTRTSSSNTTSSLSTDTTPPVFSSATTTRQETNLTTSPVSVSSSATSSTLTRTSSSNTTSSLSTNTTPPVFSSATTTRQETNSTTSPINSTSLPQSIAESNPSSSSTTSPSTTPSITVDATKESVEEANFCHLFQVCNEQVNFEMETCERRFADNVYNNRGYYLELVKRLLEESEDDDRMPDVDDAYNLLFSREQSNNHEAVNDEQKKLRFEVDQVDSGIRQIEDRDEIRNELYKAILARARGEGRKRSSRKRRRHDEEKRRRNEERRQRKERKRLRHNEKRHPDKHEKDGEKQFVDPDSKALTSEERLRALKGFLEAADLGDNRAARSRGLNSNKNAPTESSDLTKTVLFEKNIFRAKRLATHETSSTVTKPIEPDNNVTKEIRRQDPIRRHRQSGNQAVLLPKIVRSEPPSPEKMFEDCSYMAILQAISKPHCPTEMSMDIARAEMQRLIEAINDSTIFKANIKIQCRNSAQRLIDHCNMIGKCCPKSKSCEKAYMITDDRPEPPSEKMIISNARSCLKRGDKAARVRRHEKVQQKPANSWKKTFVVG